MSTPSGSRQNKLFFRAKKRNKLSLNPGLSQTQQAPVSNSPLSQCATKFHFLRCEDESEHSLSGTSSQEEDNSGKQETVMGTVEDQMEEEIVGMSGQFSSGSSGIPVATNTMLAQLFEKQSQALGRQLSQQMVDQKEYFQKLFSEKLTGVEKKVAEVQQEVKKVDVNSKAISSQRAILEQVEKQALSNQILIQNHGLTLDELKLHEKRLEAVTYLFNNILKKELKGAYEVMDTQPLGPPKRTVDYCRANKRPIPQTAIKVFFAGSNIFRYLMKSGARTNLKNWHESDARKQGPGGRTMPAFGVSECLPHFTARKNGFVLGIVKNMRKPPPALQDHPGRKLCNQNGQHVYPLQHDY